MLDYVILAGAFALFAIVVALVVRARRPAQPGAPAPMAPIPGAPADPLATFRQASRVHMEHAFFSDLGRAEAEEYKATLGRLLGPPKPPGPTPPNA